MKRLAVIALSSLLIAATIVGGNSVSAAGDKTLTILVSGTKASEGEDFILDVLPREIQKLYPDITVEATKLPDDQYYTSLKTKLATGEAPDIFWVWPKYSGAVSVMEMGKAGYLMDLSDIKNIDKLAKTGMADMSYDGKPYVITGGLSFLGTYYNKKMFQEVGVNVPTNWEEFLAVCEKLKQAGITPIVMGDKDAYVMQFGLYQIAANVVYPKNPKFDELLQAGQAKFTDGAWDTVISMYKELYDKGYVISTSLGLGNAQAIQMFNDGEAGMTFDGTFNAAGLSVQGAMEFERGYFPLPANQPGEPTYVAGAMGAGFAISATADKAEIVKGIFNVMLDGQSDLFKAWSEQKTGINIYEGVPLQNPLFADMMVPYQQGLSFYWCNQMWPAGTENEMEAKFGEIIGGQGTTVQDVTKAMQAKFEELWKK